MGFEYNADTMVELEIEGKVYRAPVDSPEFMDYWRTWRERAEELSGYAEMTGELPEGEVVDAAADVVRMCVGMVTALLGPEASRELFNGRERSLLFCTKLMEYVFDQVQEHVGKLTAAARKYSADAVQGD